MSKQKKKIPVSDFVSDKKLDKILNIIKKSDDVEAVIKRDGITKPVRRTNPKAEKINNENRNFLSSMTFCRTVFKVKFVYLMITGKNAMNAVKAKSGKD